jgi:adenosylcobinamide-phosphate synthase
MERVIILVIIPLVLGYILDLILGDPRWMPHPVKIFGNIISLMNQWFNRAEIRFYKGMFVTLFWVLGIFTLFMYAEKFLISVNIWYAVAWNTVFIYFGLANRCLINEGKAVLKALETQSLEAGRKQLSYIVGRDTSKLDANQIRTAVFETMSENLSDGVIAPLFYLAIGGVPAMMTYKMINTFDSMIGYKSERYKQFGHFAALLDDIVNYIPARLTAFLMVYVTLSKRGFRFIFKYGHQHSSPNSGFPEAALAGILNCRFGGPNMYHGVMVNKPYIGNNVRELVAADFKIVSYVNQTVTLLFIILTIILRLVL